MGENVQWGSGVVSVGQVNVGGCAPVNPLQQQAAECSAACRENS
jgi:hypothetical protein